MPSLAERGDRFGLGDLVGEHVAERAELADLQLAVAHRLDLGVVAGRDEQLHRAADLVADQLGQIIVDRQQTLRRFIRLDAEAQTALWAIGRLRGAARQQTDSGGGEEQR